MKKTMEDIVYVKSMDADANGTVAAVTDDGKLYFIRQGKIMDIVEPSEGADFSCCKFDENGLLYAELHRMRYFAMAVIRESGNTGKRKAVKNYQI